MRQRVGGAHYGTAGWLAQRVTAALMAAYTVLMMSVLSLNPVGDAAAWRNLFAGHFMAMATLLFLASLGLHAWVGVRNVLMDYVKPLGVRLFLQVAAIVVLFLCGAWSLEILWRLR